MIAPRCTTVFMLTLLLAPTLSWAQTTGQELRDPMQPPALALRKMRESKQARTPRSTPAQTKPRAAVPRPFKLTSILLGPGRGIAIIDDQMLAVGDSIRGARLVGLTRDSARLLQRGKTINLQLDDGAGTKISKRAVQDKP